MSFGDDNEGEKSASYQPQRRGTNMKKKSKTRVALEKALPRLRGKGLVSSYLVREEASRNRSRRLSHDNVMFELRQLKKEGKVTIKFNPRKWDSDRFKIRVKKGVRF